MQIWPAIDLRGGQCVRLQQGDFERETIFGADPVAMAQHWVAEGGRCLHLVDLDGAREGRPVNLPSIRGIVAAVGVPCELGGGIRDERTIDQLLELGLERLVIGTQAWRQPDWFRDMCRRYPEKLVLGIDARDGLVATEGWLETSTTPAAELAGQFRDEPIAALVYTDIARDGMMQGPNLDSLRHMQQAVGLPLVASGGIRDAGDVAQVAATGAAGCIIGRSLYEGTIKLADALAAAEAATH